jgi:hypothetical protein
LTALLVRSAYLGQDAWGTLVRFAASAAAGAVVFSVLSVLTPGLGEPHRIGIAWGIAVAAVLLPAERLRLKWSATSRL